MMSNAVITKKKHKIWFSFVIFEVYFLGRTRRTNDEVRSLLQ